MSTTQTTHSDLPIQEFIRRQRLRAESISCTPRRSFSPYPRPPTIHEFPLPATPPTSPWIQYRLLFLILLTILTTFHLFLSAPLQPFRFRTHVASAAPGHPPTRLHFLTTILPSALLQTPNPLPTSPPPPPPPFSDLTTPTDPQAYAIKATTSLAYLLSLHAPCSAHIATLADTRHATYAAARTLTRLHAALVDPARTAADTPPYAGLGPRVRDVITAVHALSRASERWAVHRSLLGAEEGLEPILRDGVRAQHHGRPATTTITTTTTDQRARWKGGWGFKTWTVRNEKRRPRGEDARVRTACEAVAFERTLDEVKARTPRMMAMAEEVRAAVEALNQAVLRACRGAVEVIGDTNMVCANALAGLWRILEPRGRRNVEDLKQIHDATTKAVIAADALLPQLESIKNELTVQRNGLDLWVMFLGTLPGGSVEEKCKL